MDLLVRNAELVDGTGAAPRRADIGVRDGLIAEIAPAGSLDASLASEVIDAAGQLVTPGFIDPHTHYDRQATWDDRLAPSCDHGVTTVVIGNCGVGFAPVHPDQHEMLIQLMEGVEDIPGAALADGITWGWESFPEYLDALEAKPRAVEVATQVPHGALRSYAIGRSGDVNGAASADDIEQMARLTREAVAAGAVAFSSNRITMHTSTTGESVPGTFADRNEIMSIMRAACEAGSPLFQVVPEGLMGEAPDAFRGEVELYRELSLETGCTVLFTISQNNVQPQLWQELLQRVEKANAEGAHLVPLTINRPGGMLMSWHTFNLFMDRPGFLELADLSPDDRVAALRDPVRRERILAEGVQTPMIGHASMIIMSSLGAIYPSGPADAMFEPHPDTSLARRIESSGLPPERVIYDALCEVGEADGGGFLFTYMGNYAEGSLDVVGEMMLRPDTLIGGGDGGAHVGVICDASYPTFMLQHWVRDRTRGARLPIEQAVRLLTHDPAEIYGLRDRGEVVVGKRADLNVIDLDRVNLHLPRLAHDLPTGAPRLLQSADGYTATLVAGQVTCRNGQDTGARPGGVVRGRR